MRILIIHGEAERRSSLGALLTDGGHQVHTRSEDRDVRALISDGVVDLLILDKPAEDSERVALCRELRALSPTLPILVLTQDGLVEERVTMLEAGADDCIAQPFAASQMFARVGALERRARLVPSKPELLEVDGCFFDLGRCRAVRNGRPLELSAREAELLRWLHRHRVRAVSRAEILEHVFGVSPEAETRSVDMAIAVLRKKIESDPSDPRIIVSVKGIGYAWGDLTHS